MRVFLEVCSWELCAAPSEGRVPDELLDNATELLEIASEYGIYVWLGSNDLPPDSYYSRAAYPGRIKIDVHGRGPNEGDPEILLHTFDEVAGPGDVLQATFATPAEGIRYVKSIVLVMDGFVTLHDVEVYAS